MTKAQKGFTLMELLIVIAIVGTLALMFAEPLRTQVDPEARRDLCDATKKRIQVAWEVYRIKHKIADGVAPSEVTDALGNAAPVDIPQLNGSGIQGDVKCPSGGEYKFQNGSTRVLCSVHDKDLW